MTNGWQPANLIILAARPAMGKTAFVLSMARNMAVEHNKGVAALESFRVELLSPFSYSPHICIYFIH